MKANTLKISKRRVTITGKGSIKIKCVLGEAGVSRRKRYMKITLEIDWDQTGKVFRSISRRLDFS